MNTKRRALLFTSMAALISACGGGNPPKSDVQPYSGPVIDTVVIYKDRRRMYLLSRREVIKAYDIDLGFAPKGHKQFEGDGKTPEGVYYIDRRNPKSNFYLSLGISYPNMRDRQFAAYYNRKPGGDIFIHGGPRPGIDKTGPDWTAGCVSVSDQEMYEIYRMVPLGAKVVIYP